MPTIIDKAEVIQPSDREVKVTRSFRAPRQLVYRAYTEPALIRRWLLGPPGWSMSICDMDVRVGGGYRWRWRSDQDGKEFGFAGTFRDVQPPSRLVHTEAYGVDGPPGLSVLAARQGGFGDPPELVVSGINPGHNTGRAVLHSGTVGAALAAANFGVSGLAVSTGGLRPDGIHAIVRDLDGERQLTLACPRRHHGGDVARHRAQIAHRFRLVAR
jgi:uncharacterized protein YndB with AHSA1/START domain